MSTIFPDLFAALTAPFPSSEVRQRDSDKKGSRKVDYITPQAVKTRLDDVLGPENWWPKYLPLATGVECELTIRLPDGTTVSRVDAGMGRDVKAAYSDALKRAAEGFGIGRHLRPGARLPAYSGRPSAIAPVSTSSAPVPDRRNAGPELAEWAKRETTETSLNVAQWLHTWGQRRNYPTRISDWTSDQADAGYEAASANIARQLDGPRAGSRTP